MSAALPSLIESTGSRGGSAFRVSADCGFHECDGTGRMRHLCGATVLQCHERADNARQLASRATASRAPSVLNPSHGMGAGPGSDIVVLALECNAEAAECMQVHDKQRVPMEGADEFVDGIVCAMSVVGFHLRIVRWICARHGTFLRDLAQDSGVYAECYSLPTHVRRAIGGSLHG